MCTKISILLLAFFFLLLLSGCHHKDTGLGNSGGAPIGQTQAQTDEAKLKQYGLSSPVVALVRRVEKNHSKVSPNDFDTIIHSIQSQRLTPKEAAVEMDVLLVAPNLDQHQKQEALKLSQHLTSSNYKDDTDGQVKGAALMVLGKIEKKKAIPYLSTFLNDSQDYVSSGAKTGIFAAKR